MVWNKGKKLGYVPSEAFKEGHIPWNKGSGRANYICNPCNGKKAKYAIRCRSCEDKRRRNEWPRGFKRPNMWGNKHPRWKGGKNITQDGYVSLSLNGQILLEHRYVMEKYLARKLSSEEEVHHVNGNKQDNRAQNLDVMSGREHTLLHISLKQIPSEATIFGAIKKR